MPRSGRGGQRQGSPGQPYGNRTDLSGGGKPVPNQTAPGQPYGAAAAEAAGMRAVPVSQPAGPPTGAPVPTSAPNASPDLPAQPPAGNQKFPGELPWLHPTNRPHEPVTSGLPTGPGPGPEALQGIGALARQQSDESGSLKQLLGSMAAAPGASSAIRDLASTAGAG